MNVTVKPELEAFIRDQVDSGKYENVDHAVEHAIRLLQDHEKLLYLRAAIAKGQEQPDRGEGIELTPEFVERLKREAAENVQNGRPIKRDVLP